MYKADLKGVVERLNPFCMDKLQAAAGLTVSMTHYEVTPEHLLAKLNESADSDFAHILRSAGLDQGALARSLERSLEGSRRGNAGRPVLSPILVELLQDAWLIASIELKDVAVRSGAVLLAFLSNPGLAAGADWGEYLRTLSRERVRTGYAQVCAGSVEDKAARAAAPDGAPAGPDGERKSGPLAQFCVDFTAKARAGDMDPVFGRDREIRQMVDILARRRKNNPIIVGDAGVGKTAVAEGLALRIAEGDVPEVLKDVSILALDLGLLQAGAGIRGEFEQRLKAVIDAVKQSPSPVILFIDEAHVLIGAGDKAGGSDAANLLKPALARGELRTIAATTWGEYKKYFEKDAALARRFQPVRLDEPSVDATVTILRGLKARYEADHGVVVRDDAVRAAADLADRYISGRLLPDKAVDLLDTACARVRVLLSSKPAALEDRERSLADVERRIAALTRDESQGVAVDPADLAAARAEAEGLRVQAGELSGRWDTEKAAVAKFLELRAPAAPEGAEEGGEAAPAPDPAALAAARAELAAVQVGEPLIHFEVDPDMVAKVVSDWTGIPLGKVLRDEAGAVLRLEDDLKRRIRGQDRAVAAVAKVLRASKSGLKEPALPLGVFLLVGPSGVGKTETALAVADLLFGDEARMVTVNLSEFQEKHTVSRLIGSPPGYVGFGEGGVLTEAVRRQPYSVVLLDEAEKAAPDVMNLFYQVFDKGMLADGEGRVVDFKNTILFLTSNLGSDLITEYCAAGGVRTEDGLMAGLKPALADHFKPALLARMTVVPYMCLGQDALREIIGLKLARLAATLRRNNAMTLEHTPAVVERILERCTDLDTGARTIDHLLRGSILPRLSQEILARMVEGAPAAKAVLDVEAGGGFSVAVGD
ncbi:MAG: type VI secretion system ATPase TssH [Thermodesulfobacteriota bacterium]